MIGSVITIFSIRPGSLNALEKLNHLKSWNSDSPRASQKKLYSLMKRNKQLAAPSHGLIALVFDGHESHNSYKQHCKGCLERQLEGRIQYYHHNVTVQLNFANFRFLLDVEQQLPHEGEYRRQNEASSICIAYSMGICGFELIAKTSSLWVTAASLRNR